MDLTRLGMDSVLHANSHKPQEANQTIQYSWVIHHCLKVFASLLYELSMLHLVFFMLWHEQRTWRTPKESMESL
jgi:hypothetical protein